LQAETTETVSGDSLSGVARWKGLADDTDTDTDTNTRIATMECVSRSSLVAQGLVHYGRRLLNPKRTTVVSVPRALFACADTRAAFGDKQRPRVAQLYRDPFDMVVSGYLYHLEGNEAWINTYTPKAGSVRYAVIPYSIIEGCGRALIQASAPVGSEPQLTPPNCFRGVSIGQKQHRTRDDGPLGGFTRGNTARRR
jgi:hypothetical protein